MRCTINGAIFLAHPIDHTGELTTNTLTRLILQYYYFNQLPIYHDFMTAFIL